MRWTRVEESVSPGIWREDCHEVEVQQLAQRWVINQLFSALLTIITVDFFKEVPKSNGMGKKKKCVNESSRWKMSSGLGSKCITLNPRRSEPPPPPAPSRALRNGFHDLCGPVQRDGAEGGVPGCPGQRGGADAGRLEEILLWGNQTDFWLRGAAALRLDSSSLFGFFPPPPGFLFFPLF